MSFRTTQGEGYKDPSRAFPAPEPEAIFCYGRSSESNLYPITLEVLDRIFEKYRLFYLLCHGDIEQNDLKEVYGSQRENLQFDSV